MSDLTVHPVADLFPMLAEDELRELAEDIKQRGLLHPIVLDGEGRVLDGRNRLAACAMAEIEPTFTTYLGDDPDGYALAVNVSRRHLNKGQMAMVIARARAVYSVNSVRDAASQADVSASRISQANAVLKFAPELADSVVSGVKSLNDAYDVARQRKAAAVEEEQRRRLVSTHLLCEHVVAVAQTRGTSTFGYYDPGQVLPGRAVTRQVIEDAIAALEEMADEWKARGLS